MVISMPCGDCGEGEVGCDGECSNCGPSGFPCGTRMRSFQQLRFDFSEPELIEVIQTAQLFGEYGCPNSVPKEDAIAIASALIAYAKKRDEPRI
jgi:hypothetical protein